MDPAEIIDPRDWTTIWQSELTALAVDREAHEALAALSQLWAGAGRDAGPAGHDGPAGRPGPDATPGAAAPGAAPGNGDDVARLRQRIAELERAASSGRGP